jgi:hypothetical protein
MPSRSLIFIFGYGTRGSYPLLGLPTDAPVVMVGEKPGLPHIEPPYPFEEWSPEQDQGTWWDSEVGQGGIFTWWARALNGSGSRFQGAPPR